MGWLIMLSSIFIFSYSYFSYGEKSSKKEGRDTGETIFFGGPR